MSTQDDTPTRASAPQPATVEWGPAPSPHALMAHYDGGYWSVTVTCPDAHLGAERPCAVWEDGDGTKRQNACTFQQYASDLDPEEWLHGRHDFGPVSVIEAASGDEWHAQFMEVSDVTA